MNTSYSYDKGLWLSKVFILGVILLCIFLCACSENKQNDELVQIGKDNITQSQFDTYLQYKRIPVTDGNRKGRIFDQYVERTALAQVIEEEPVLDKVLVAIEFEELKKEMLIGRYFEAYLKEAVSDQAVLNYYNMHPEEFETKKAHVAHILIRTRSNMDEVERKAKLTTAHEAYSKVRAATPFEEAAKNYSEDRVSGDKGGDLGWISEGAISPKLSEVAFSLKAGDVSEPFETPFGFHVVKLLEDPRVIKKTFESVKGTIRYQLRENAKQKEIERLLVKADIVKP